MKNVNVYGSGCKNCTNTIEIIEKTAKALNIEVMVEKITDLQAMMEAGVMSTPAVSIDGQLVHAGSVPDAEEVARLLS